MTRKSMLSLAVLASFGFGLVGCSAEVDTQPNSDVKTKKTVTETDPNGNVTHEKKTVTDSNGNTRTDEKDTH